jgi:hypothetical protein
MEFKSACYYSTLPGILAKKSCAINMKEAFDKRPRTGENCQLKNTRMEIHKEFVKCRFGIKTFF